MFRQRLDTFVSSASDARCLPSGASNLKRVYPKQPLVIVNESGSTSPEDITVLCIVSGPTTLVRERLPA